MRMLYTRYKIPVGLLREKKKIVTTRIVHKSIFDAILLNDNELIESTFCVLVCLCGISINV